MEEKTFNIKTKHLKRLLIQFSNIALPQLKDSLLIDSNSELLSILEKLLLKEINSISYINCDDDLKWFYICLKFIIEIITTDQKENNVENFILIEKIKNSLIMKQNDNNGNIPNNLKQFYIKMLNILKPLADILDKQNKQEQKKQSQIARLGLYKLAKKLIFEIRNFDYVYQISRTYPNIINCCNDKGIPIIESIIKKQIKNIKLKKDMPYILYFNRIINLIVNSNYFYLNNKQLMDILKLLKSQLYNCHKEDNELNKFINELIDSLKRNSKNITIAQDVRKLYDEYGIKEVDKVNFPEIILDKDLKEKVYDFTDKYVITMDLSKNIRVYDDAISLEILPNNNYLIGVYIADVTHYIDENSELDLIAYDRAETIYLNNKTIDMLPLELLNHCSLINGEKRRVVAYMFEFTDDGLLYDFKVYNAIIRVRHNLTFNNALKLYHMNYTNEVGKIIRDFVRFNQKLNKSNFYNKNYHILKEEKRRINNQEEFHSKNECSNIVEALMILVNSSLAKFFYDNSYPFLYRVNNSNMDDQFINKIKNTFDDNSLPLNILRKFDTMCSSSKYSYINTGHNGLNLGFYCHTTNPLRSYASLFTQRIIKKEFIDGGLSDQELCYYEKIIPKVASSLNKTIDSYNSFTEDYNKLIKRKR